MIKYIIQKKLNFDKAIANIEHTTNNLNNTECHNLNSDNKCQLIANLKEKQKLQYLIKNEILNRENIDVSAIPKLFKFLDDLEAVSKCRWYSYSGGITRFFKSFGINNLIYILSITSNEDIDDIANELKNLKLNEFILHDRQKDLEKLEQEITDIKTKLGIE